MKLAARMGQDQTWRMKTYGQYYPIARTSEFFAER
jgi:hypothetical protein